VRDSKHTFQIFKAGFIYSGGKKGLGDFVPPFIVMVVRDLSYMGIAAWTLFPGLDGARKELRERNFAV
jgi:hypothetical protein